MKYNKLYIAVILLLIGLMVYADYETPKKVDWNRTFRSNDKNPFGMEVFHKTLPELFTRSEVQTVRVPPFNLLSETSLPSKSNYIVIDQYLDQRNGTKGLSDGDVEELLYYISEGNNVFLASNSFPELLLDTLNLKIRSVSLGADLTSKLKGKNEPLKVKLLNPVFKNKTVTLEKESYEGYFISKDTLNVKALAVNDSLHANFIHYKIGNGKLFLLTVPEVFSNYYMLEDEKDPIAYKIISYLPDLPTYYDEYSKQGRLGEQSIFRFIKSKPALQSAYYLCLSGILLFLFFEGKRRQRIIPVVTPKENSTLNFIRTVGGLFYHKKNNLALGQKKIEYLKWLIYKKTGVRFEGYTEEFKSKLIQKTGIEAAEIDSLTEWMQSIESTDAINDNQIITFNHMIESFHKKTI